MPLVLLIILGLGLTFAACGEEGMQEDEPRDGTAPEGTVVEEASYSVGDAVWATYFDPEYVSALTWEEATVVAVGEDSVTVEFHGFLNAGERATRGIDRVYPYVEVWRTEEAVPGATVVIEPPGASFVAYPGVIRGVREGAYAVDYEVDGVPHTDEFALEALH